MGWKDLNITLKAELIKLGIRSGIKDINLIRQLYDNVDIKDYLHPYYTNKTVPKDNILSLNQDNTLIKGMIDDFNRNKHNIPQLNIYSQNNLGTERIDNQNQALFLLFKGGGYISNNSSMSLVGEVRKYKEGGYEDEDENTIYTAGYSEPINVKASRKLSKRQQMLADEEWRKYLAKHPIQIGSEEYNRLPERAKAQVYKNKVIDDTNKMALPIAAAIVAPTALAVAGASTVPLIEGVAANWATLGPILKETGKRMLASELGYLTVSEAYKLGTNGRDLLTDTGNTLFPYIENQTVKDVLSSMANPGGWIGIPGQAMANSFKEATKPVVTRMITGDAYTTLGGKFGYYGNTLKERAVNTIKRRLGLKTDPSHPEFLRKIDADYLTVDKDGNIDILAGQKPNREYVNFTTDRHVVSHTADWDYMPGLIINPTEFKSHTPISIEPSDTFFRRPQNMTANPKNTTLVSGSTEELNKARSLGMETLSSRKLRRLYKKMAESSGGKPDRRSNYRKLYTQEIQRLTNKRGSPDINDYKYIEELYGLKSGVVPIKDVNINELINLYKLGLLVKYPNNSLLQRKDPGYILKRKYNKVFYDPTSSIEYDYIKKMSVPQLYSDLHTLGFEQGGFLFPNLAFSHKFDDGGYTKHSIAKGDTLSDISRKYNVKMDAILTANPDIKDPNLIYAGDNIYIPKKVQNFIPKEEIPRRNELLQEITDYSKDFDYIIEGEKIYYSRKGKNNYVDISHNEKARRNLFNHIAKKEFNGYNNGEKELYEKIKNNTYSYGDYNLHSNYDNPIPGYEYVSTPNGLELRRKKQVQELEKEEKVEKTESVSKLDFGYSKEQKDYINSLMQLSSEDLKKEVEDKENSFNPFDYLELIGPGIKRMWNKHVTQGKNDPITNIDRSNWELPESAYALRPDSYVGDTVPNGDRRYIVPESIKVDDYTYGYRNRGDYSSIDSESAGITAFTSFEPYGQHVKGRNTYIGIDSLGNLKVGDESSFSDGDFLTPTFSNDIAYFMKDSDGNIVQSKSTKNPRLNLPAYALWNNGNIIEKPTGQAVNILIRKDDKKGTQYGNITGGRVLVKVGDEMRLLSGSMSDIDKEFEEMKKRNNAEYGTFYTLDNGSYNRGLRTYDSKFTELDLRDYDRLNSGGGNFLYVKDKKILQDLYPSDTIWTPNVRTVEDESYKKGHDIVNEVLGAVFHHTASTDPDLTGVTKLLTSKNGNSAHVVIGHGGERVVLAKPELVTFHAGLSMHNGRDNVNDFMIGIEFQGVTQTYDKKEGKYKKGIPLTEDLINSAVEYLKPIIKQYQIPLENLVTHLLIRDSYNDYMKKTKGKQAEVKPDIHYDDYQRIINKLLEEVYYKK